MSAPAPGLERRSPHRPTRRAGDRHFRPRENWHRDVWLLLITGLVAYALVSMAGVISDQREGRRIAVRALCGATDGVIDAGRATITGSAGGLNPELTRFLERHGYPPKPIRQAQADKAARLYGRSIGARVELATGLKGLVEPDGGLDCERLAAVSNASSTPGPNPTK